jgi:hypothetical protein
LAGPGLLAERFYSPNSISRFDWASAPGATNVPALKAAAAAPKKDLRRIPSFFSVELIRIVFSSQSRFIYSQNPFYCGAQAFMASFHRDSGHLAIRHPTP